MRAGNVDSKGFPRIVQAFLDIDLSSCMDTYVKLSFEYLLDTWTIYDISNGESFIVVYLIEFYQILLTAIWKVV